MRVKAPRGARPECSAAQRHLPGLVRAHRRDAAAARALLRRLRPADDRRSVGCAAVAELEAPPAQTGLQLEVTFEEPDDKVPVTFITTTARVVSIGDIHGDINKAMRSLVMAGVASFEGGVPRWIGGDTVVVQLGDILDRGDAEIATLMLLRQLGRQAEADGGAVHILNGNHESLNVCGDFRYVTSGAFTESGMVMGLSGAQLQDLEVLVRARLALYTPGQPMAIELSKNPTVLVVNDTVFAHGGLLPIHVDYGIERINAEVAAWMRADQNPDGGLAPPPFIALGNAEGVMWNRTFGKEKWVSPVDRMHATQLLDNTLGGLGCRRLVVGHTPQMGGANAECDGRVWRLDVGMSRNMLDAAPAVLELNLDSNGDTVPSILQ